MKNYHRLGEIQKELRNHKITCHELVSHYLRNIEKHQDLNAFLEVYKEEALQQAEILDRK